MVSGTLANAGRPERVIKQNIKCFEVFKSFLKLYTQTLLGHYLMQLNSSQCYSTLHNLPLQLFSNYFFQLNCNL
jgi:hypothetical protein